MTKPLFLIFIVFFALVSCGTRPVKFQANEVTSSNISAGKGLTMSATWLKNRGRTIEIMLMIFNSYENEILIENENIKLTSDGQIASLDRADLRNIPAGTSYSGVFVFEFAEKLPKHGSAELTLSAVKFKNDDKATPLNLKMNLPLRK